MNYEIEWLVAVLAPWTISPHPNFSEKQITRVAELALVTERRDERELDRYDLRQPAIGEEWRVDLVDAARKSLYEETQETATNELWEIARTVGLPMGARIAAAMFGSVGLAEVEKPHIAADMLLAIFDETTGSLSPIDFSPVERLGLASLLQQRVARLEDACAYTAAREAADTALLWVPNPGARFDDEFPVSQGISWNAATVLEDIACSLADHALASKAHLEQWSGETWIQVVKNRAGWVDQRVASRAAERDGMVLRDAFERAFESTSGTRYLMRELPTDKGYAALLLAELSGFTSRIRSSREALGKVLLMEGSDDAGRVREAVRLLRQGRGTKSLQSALKWIRGQGPSAALNMEARAVTARALDAGWITEADLAVLEAASDFLDPNLLRDAVMAAFVFENTEQVSGRAGWAVLDKMWKAVGRLVEDSGLDDFVAAQAAIHLEQPDKLSEPFSSTLAKAVEAIDWAAVSTDTREKWKNWAKKAGLESPDAQQLRGVVSNLVGGRKRGIEAFEGLARAAYLADTGLPAGKDSKLLPEVRGELIKLLDNEAEAARRGVISFGGFSTANVAVAFAARFSDQEVWLAISRYLVDGSVDLVLKDQALERMASRPKDIPLSVRSALQAGWESLVKGERNGDIFGAEPLPVFAPGVRLGGILGIISRDEALNAVLQLASSGDAGRVQAARTIPFIIGNGDATWGHVLLLQLAQDANPEVRAEAGQSLVLSMKHVSPLTTAVRESVVQLMQSDGLRIPLKVLHGMQRLAIEGVEGLDDWRQPIEQLTKQNHPRVVRGAAIEALNQMDKLG